MNSGVKWTGRGRPERISSPVFFNQWAGRESYSREVRVAQLRGRMPDVLATGGRMSNDGSDQPVLGHIDALVKEEESLYAQSELTDSDRGRLAEIKVELDQCWDLLRQRRALREFGGDPEKAKVRPANVVEEYEQ